MALPKNSNIGAKLAITVLILAVMSTIAWWLLNRKKPHFVHYPEFGIELPANYPIHGIDVSKYQQRIEWQEVKAMQAKDLKISFAFIKATEGLSKVDRFFNRNWKNAQETNMIRGAYHYFLATRSGKAQAENFIKAVQLEKGDLPPVLDVEQTYGVPTEKLLKNVKEFLDTVEEYYGITPIIYTNVDFYDHHLKAQFDRYPLWVAHYLQKESPRVSKEWLFWQHSETGSVNGIVSKVDFNVFNGDSADFRKLLMP